MQKEFLINLAKLMSERRNRLLALYNSFPILSVKEITNKLTTYIDSELTGLEKEVALVNEQVKMLLQEQGQ